MDEVKVKIYPGSIKSELQKVAVKTAQHLACMTNIGIMYHYGKSKDEHTRKALREARIQMQKVVQDCLDEIYIANKSAFNNYEKLTSAHVK